MNYSNIITICFCLITVSACSLIDNNSEIDAFLSAEVSQRNAPGIMAMAADKTAVFYSGAFGKMDISREPEITIDTLVRIASMTKPITSVAALQLVEKGLLELDGPLETYLPALSNLQILDGFDQAGSPILRSSPKSVTLRQLLTHTSGFVYTFSNEDALRFGELGNNPIVLEKGNNFLNAPLAREPGKQWEYGIGVDWVGLLIEKITNQTLEEYFREHIFEPLKMNNTQFHLDEEQQQHLATLYVKSKDGTLTDRGPWQNDAFLSGGSGLVSTTRDFMRFLQTILNRGEFEGMQILKPETVDLMTRNNIGNIDVRAVLHSYQPNRSLDIKFFDKSKAKFGLGFLINTDPIPGARNAGSLTWGGLYNTFFWIDPKSGICGVFITQVLPFFDPETIDTFNQFEKLIYQSISKEDK